MGGGARLIRNSCRISWRCRLGLHAVDSASRGIIVAPISISSAVPKKINSLWGTPIIAPCPIKCPRPICDPRFDHTWIARCLPADLTSGQRLRRADCTSCAIFASDRRCVWDEFSRPVMFRIRPFEFRIFRGYSTPPRANGHNRSGLMRAADDVIEQLHLQKISRLGQASVRLWSV